MKHYPLDNLIDLQGDEAEDLAIAAAAMARHWKAHGLGEAVRAIGPEQGVEGARVFLGEYYEARHKRLQAKFAEAADEIPF
jgi:hypothetical protein